MRRLAGGCLLALLTIAMPAAAQSDTKRAEALFKQGLDLVDAAARDHDTTKYEQARTRFSEAYALAPRASVLFNLARTEQLTGRLEEALTHYNAYVAAKDAPRAAEAKQRIVELRRHMAQIQVVAPEGATVRIDGGPAKSVSREPLDVTIGAHRVDVEAPSGEKRTVEIALQAGQTEAVTLETKPPPTRPTPSPIPSETAPATPGGAPGAGPFTNDAPRTEPARESGRSTLGYVVPIALVGAGAIGIVTGIAFGAASNNAADRADAIRRDHPANACSSVPQPSFCADASDATNAQNRDATLSKVFLVAGGAMAAGGVAAFLLWPTSKETTSAGALRPSIGRGFVGAAYAVSFE